MPRPGTPKPPAPACPFDRFVEPLVKAYETARADALRADVDHFAVASAAARAAERRLHAAIEGFPADRYYSANGYCYARDGEELVRSVVRSYPTRVVATTGGFRTTGRGYRRDATGSIPD